MTVLADLDGRTWSPAKDATNALGAAAGADLPRGTTVAATLEVTGRDEGVVHPPDRHDLAYHRLGPNAFSSPESAIR